jgi:hypothetical protein
MKETGNEKKGTNGIIAKEYMSEKDGKIYWGITYEDNTRDSGYEKPRMFLFTPEKIDKVLNSDIQFATSDEDSMADGAEKKLGQFIADKVVMLEGKNSLNEHYVAGGIVGIGAINQIPSRAKADYEDAFEYFLSQKYSINEAEETSVDATSDKVEKEIKDEVEALVAGLDPKEKEQYKAELEKLNITADTDPDAIAGKINKSLFEAEGDNQTKIANALSNIGGGLMKSLLVPIIPVAIGSMGPGVAAGLAITAGTAGILIALAKALGAEKSMEEGKEVEEPYNY